MTAAPHAADPIVWRPSAADIERSRLRQFYEDLGLASADELQARAAADPGWYWDAVVRDLGFEWSRPYTQALDLSRGKPWAEWFVGGGFNYVHNALDRWIAAGRGDRPAIVWEGDDGATRRLSYAETHEAVDWLAAALRGLGVGKGDRVGIFMPMLPETAIATLACGQIGAMFVPMFSGFGPEALASRLRDAEANLLITTDGGYRRGQIVPLKQTADDAMAQAPSVERCLVLRHTGEPAPWRPERDVWWDDALAAAPVERGREETAANDPYMLIYTSGTTGRPKGAVHVQAGFPIKAAHDLAYCFDLGPDDVLFWLTDLGWMMGPWLIEGGLLLGATVVLFEGTPDYPEPDRLWRLVEDHKISVCGVAPTAIRALMARGTDWVRNRDRSSLRILGSTGETWNPEPWRWYFQEVGEGRCPIINYSGGTETGGGIVGCTTLRPETPCAFTGPVPGMIADVVDDAGESVRGAVGELVVRQPWVGMTQGFWRDPERYLDAYWRRFPGVWVHGDWAEIDDDGFWFIRGRSDDTLKVAGKRIGPAELESAATAHPAVQEAAAIGAPHPVKGETAIVFAVLRPGHAPSDELAEEIRQTIAAQLGAAMRPEQVRFVADLPKTRNAKIMRRVIRAAWLGLPPGDLTALENPGAVAEIEEAREA
ncbi:MAG TPA: AMP-binding protein [Thermomicrobiales bacterium]|nr:AMP-binding protein [Thermomicrobiales bacterium]